MKHVSTNLFSQYFTCLHKVFNTLHLELSTCVQKQFPKQQVNLEKDQIFNTTRYLKNKFLIAQNLIIHYEITRESIQRSLVFHQR